mgnify:CR=1 FL=1
MSKKHAEPPVPIACAECGRKFLSKYARKTHVCRGLPETYAEHVGSNFAHRLARH